MLQDLAGTRLYHVTRPVPWNSNPSMELGTRIFSGEGHNPFFSFYETPKTVPVTTPEGLVSVSIMTFLRSVREGQIQTQALPIVAHDGLQHYVMLVREIVMEETRREIAPTAPSRQSCLWATESPEAAAIWRDRLGGACRIAVLKAVGRIARVDGGLLLGDAEPLSETYAKARAYWRGESAARPEPEILFAGSAVVEAFV